MSSKEFISTLTDYFSVRTDNNGNHSIEDMQGFTLSIADTLEIISQLQSFVENNTEESITAKNKTFCAQKYPYLYEQLYKEPLPNQFKQPQYKVNGQIPERMETGGYVYMLKSEKDGTHKIGMTINPRNRFSDIAGDVKSNLTVIHLLQVDETKDLPIFEFYWHEKFWEKRTHGEWFNLNQADVQEFINFNSQSN